MVSNGVLCPHKRKIDCTACDKGLDLPKNSCRNSGFEGSTKLPLTNLKQSVKKNDKSNVTAQMAGEIVARVSKVDLSSCNTGSGGTLLLETQKAEGESPGYGWLCGLRAHIAGSCPIFHPPVSPSPSLQGCSQCIHPLQPILILGIAPTQVQDLALGLVELHIVHIGPLLKPVK
ncbi:hypothetical protein QYF61_001446 [Mycteria americana]|uniref:Uncharacterized protein n=1 Tax=Mycteria americana TaxID=33587 RepID=A0AAN7SHY8_MYCAM|nr:hypothetical protein QYF61_001446 [Mycteria americana]